MDPDQPCSTRNTNLPVAPGSPRDDLRLVVPLAIRAHNSLPNLNLKLNYVATYEVIELLNVPFYLDKNTPFLHSSHFCNSTPLEDLAPPPRVSLLSSNLFSTQTGKVKPAFM